MRLLVVVLVYFSISKLVCLLLIPPPLPINVRVQKTVTYYLAWAEPVKRGRSKGRFSQTASGKGRLWKDGLSIRKCPRFAHVVAIAGRD